MPAVERFRASVRRLLGLEFDSNRDAMLRELLRRRARIGDHSDDGYLAMLEGSPQAGELGALAQELTVTETSFFRNPDQIRAFAEAVLPSAAAVVVAGRRPLRVLSAGCASGEEPYTLAACVRECPALIGRELEIWGIDINKAMLRKAAAGRYSDWSLRQTPDALRQAMFRHDGSDFVLADAIRAMVTFEERNLIADDQTFWSTGRFDIVFLRNVLMYFSPTTARAVVERITRSLAPGGYLFLGYAETLRGLSTRFQICHTHDAFYYRLKSGRTAPESPTVPETSAIRVTPPPDLAHAGLSRRESESRLGSTRSSRRPATSRMACTPRIGARRLLETAELIVGERFAEAAAALHGLNEAQAHEPEALLLSAILQTHGGNIPVAERICDALLARDDFNAGAHHLLALCQESSGDLESAARHDRIAAYIDPGFAMPRLHLGLLARRAGRLSEARRHIEQALLLLEKEDGLRFHLFAGGFGRAALAALCRAELTTCEAMS